MLAFIDDIFSENISDFSLVKQITCNKSCILHTPNSLMQKSVKQCINKLLQDSDFMTINTQWHIYDAVYVKYDNAKKQKQNTSIICWFSCSWRCHDMTHVDEKTGNINLCWHDFQINCFNRSITTALWYNHDFIFIVIKTRMLSTFYYISNYMTKFKTFIYQCVILMLMIANNEAKKWTNQMSNSKTIKMFMQWVFNKICTECKLSAVEVCMYFLSHNFNYCSILSKEWVWVHLKILYWCIVWHWRLLWQAFKSEDKAGNETDQMRLITTEIKFTLFSAYFFCEEDLKSLCFYNYISLIKIEGKSENHKSYLTCFDFVNVPQLQIFTQWVWFTEDIVISVFLTTFARTKDMMSKFWYD